MTPIPVTVRPLAHEDLPRLSRWLAEPHVATWWRDPSDLASVQATYLPCIGGTDPTEVFVIEAAGRAAGLIQRYLVADGPAWDHALRATGAIGMESAEGAQGAEGAHGAEGAEGADGAQGADDAAGAEGGCAAGIDYLIGEPALCGRGYGTAAIAVFTTLTFRRYPQVGAVVAAPQQANVASWRALERAGYSRWWAGQLESADPSDAGPAYLYGASRREWVTARRS